MIQLRRFPFDETSSLSLPRVHIREVRRHNGLRFCPLTRSLDDIKWNTCSGSGLPNCGSIPASETARGRTESSRLVRDLKGRLAVSRCFKQASLQIYIAWDRLVPSRPESSAAIRPRPLSDKSEWVWHPIAKLNEMETLSGNKTCRCPSGLYVVLYSSTPNFSGSSYYGLPAMPRFFSHLPQLCPDA